MVRFFGLYFIKTHLLCTSIYMKMALSKFSYNYLFLVTEYMLTINILFFPQGIVTVALGGNVTGDH